jgi:subtilisin family serine protease
MDSEFNIDPRLKLFLEYLQDVQEQDQLDLNGSLEVFIGVSPGIDANWVKAIPGVTEFVHVVDRYHTAKIAVREIPAIVKALSGRSDIDVEVVRYLKASLNKSVERIHGKAGTVNTDPRNKGAGAVIGIVDYGIDFTLDDFRHPDSARKETRIAYLWDQALTAQNGENPPPKYGYGVEYSKEQIDNALNQPDRKASSAVVQHNPRNPQFADIDGHGTHVAGIAAGNGKTIGTAPFSNPDEYVGVAPASTLVFVNLARKKMLTGVAGEVGTLANSVNLAHAIAYCFEMAEKMGKPCVVNLSMGFNGGGHDGKMVVERIIDALLLGPVAQRQSQPGRAVVVSAGNENTKKQHASGHLQKDQSVELVWRIGSSAGRPLVTYDDPTANELEVWYSKGNRMSVQLIAPDHQDQDKSDEIFPEGVYAGTHHYQEGERVSIYSDTASPWGGDARIHISLRKGSRKSGIRAGDWKIVLKAYAVNADEGVRYDAWIERAIVDNLQPNQRESRFVDGSASEESTLTTPSTAESVITVAAFSNAGPIAEHRAPDRYTISTDSGRGPTRDKRKKPELAAPGNSIMSSNARAGDDENGSPRPARVAKSGTSMAAPHVTGVVARLFGRKHDLTAIEILDILKQSAAKPEGYDDWDPKWGYGMVDAERAIQKLEELYGLPHS